MIRGIFVGRRITIKFPNLGNKKKEMAATVYSSSPTWSNFKFKEVDKKNGHSVQYVLWDNLGRDLPVDHLYEVTRVTRVQPSYYQNRVLNININVDGNIMEDTKENRKNTNYRLGVRETIAEKLLDPTEYDGIDTLSDMYNEDYATIDIDIDSVNNIPKMYED